jgi:hypothetical protein
MSPSRRIWSAPVSDHLRIDALSTPANRAAASTVTDACLSIPGFVPVSVMHRPYGRVDLVTSGLWFPSAEVAPDGG